MTIKCRFIISVSNVAMVAKKIVAENKTISERSEIRFYDVLLTNRLRVVVNMKLLR